MRPFHQPGKVVGDDLLTDGLLQAVHDQIGDFLPTHIFKHHHARKNDGAGVDFVQVGVFGRRAVSGFENSVTADVVDVAAIADNGAKSVCVPAC